ncbi:MAG: glycosyltransferase [Bacteroidetes bacterium]|nr:glycosyltransferase [Bacteroidota bacterium]
MKILILGTAYPWRGGIAHYVGLLTKYLTRFHAVDVVTFKRQYPTVFFPGKSQEEAGSPGIQLRTEQLVDSMNPLNWIRVGYNLRRRGYDVLIFKYWLPFFGPCFGTIARIVKYRTKTIVLAICDNVIPHERRVGDRIFTNYAFSAVDGFLVQSNTVEADLKRMYPYALSKRVEHPVYELFGDPIPKAEARQRLGITAEKVLLFFGYIRQYKGLDILFEAFAHVATPLQAKLYVVGEFYDDEEKYHRQVQSLHLETMVEFVSHYIPNESVALYFCAADCVVLPYRSATQSGIVQIAYHFDTPVIVTDVGGLAEVVNHRKTGFVVPPCDTIALADAIRTFYTEGWEPRLREGVRKEKSRFSWETLVKAIEEFVEVLRSERA